MSNVSLEGELDYIDNFITSASTPRGKITVINPLKYIIPINKDKGIIMISYTDGYWAKKWNKIEEYKLCDIIHLQLRKIFNNMVNKPLKIIPHYWVQGAAVISGILLTSRF